jgi:hypothetical protein
MRKAELNIMPKQDVILKLNSIDELFNAPDVNPFSENEIDVLGEAALPHAVRQMLARRIRHWHEARLVIQLPPDQITPDLQAQTRAAVRRFCTAKIEDNRLTIRLSRVRSAIGLALVAIISVAVIVVAWLLFNTIFAALTDTLGVVVAFSISVFVWVILWDPMEKLIFDWVTPALENRNLRGIMDMELVIEPWQ